MKRVVWVLAFMAILIGGAAIYQAGILDSARSQTPAAPRQAPAVPVTAASVMREPTPVRLDTIGSVQTIANVTVKSRIDGVITEVPIHDGQYVKTGDVMFRLDARAAQALLDQAKGQLARDRAQLAYAQQEVKRFAPLEQKSFVSKEQLEQQQMNAASFEAAVQADLAAVENASVQLSYNTMLAPIDGRVGVIAIKTGNSIKANDLPLATINQVSPIYVSFSLPQATLPEIRSAMAAGAVQVSALPSGDDGAPEMGQLAFFDNAVDVNSGTIGLRATFTNEQQRLWPGQFVNVSIMLRVEANALTVPQAAVQVGQNGAYVYVVKPDSTAELRPVSVNRTVDGKSVIAKGVTEGERVVTDGQLRLVNGSRVEIRAADTAKPGAAS